MFCATHGVVELVLVLKFPFVMERGKFVGVGEHTYNTTAHFKILLGNVLDTG